MLRFELFAWFPVRSFRLASADQLVAAVGRWRQRARQRRQLMRLDDALLKDIGLTRCEAEYEAKKPFWRE